MEKKELLSDILFVVVILLASLVMYVGFTAITAVILNTR
jgi:hypothetical protein